MKKLLLTLSLIIPSLLFAQNYTIVIHGGAGNISKDMPEQMQVEYKAALNQALQVGIDVLENQGSAIDAVEQVINSLEDCPLFNAGKGAVYTYDGHVELDASIMDGRDLNAGAISGVRSVKNPISTARKVMEESVHVMLSGQGADDFAKSVNQEQVDNDYFKTERRTASWERAKKRLDKDKMGTVGCVVLDKAGNLAAGTSTGGMNMKRWGRVGDSPIIGAGTYADNNSCAISCTGHGEYYIRLAVAKDISARMVYQKATLEDSMAATLQALGNMGGTGGIIGVDANGEVSMQFNTTGMFRASAKSNGERIVAIH